jgi:hypothetical protein
VNQQKWTACAADDCVEAEAIGVDYRLVKVFAKPRGKFGAPETATGPAGTSSEDALTMTR